MFMKDLSVKKERYTKSLDYYGLDLVATGFHECGKALIYQRFQELFQ